MPKARTIAIASAAVAAVLAVTLLVVNLVLDTAESAPVFPAAGAGSGSGALRHDHSGFIYGRVTADGTTYEGRMRWGGDQEAFWGDYFDGFKVDNRWSAHAPGDAGAFEILGIEIGGNRPNLGRPFMARFGDIARVDTSFRRVQVRLKSGTVVTLDRFAAGDIDDGIRVWDATHGMVDLDTRVIRTVEFLPTPPLPDAPGRLYGAVRARGGEFTGFIVWDQRDAVSTDTLDGAGGVSVRYDTIRSIARQPDGSAAVTLVDGRQMALSSSRETGREHRGIYVEDDRFGRVQISWEAFERVDFSPAGSGHAYDDLPPGAPLVGAVTTRDGRSLAGRLVYDFDESETTDTFDVSDADVTYNIPLGLIASIVPTPRDEEGVRPARITLHDGRELYVERSGDLGDRTLGVLVFADGDEQPEFVPWDDVERIDIERAPAMSPQG